MCIPVGILLFSQVRYEHSYHKSSLAILRIVRLFLAITGFCYRRKQSFLFGFCGIYLGDIWTTLAIFALKTRRQTVGRTA